MARLAGFIESIRMIDQQQTVKICSHLDQTEQTHPSDKENAYPSTPGLEVGVKIVHRVLVGKTARIVNALSRNQEELEHSRGPHCRETV
jgi:hypothetical protein